MQYTSAYRSPVGEILLACDEIGLTGLWFQGGKYFALKLDREHQPQETPVLLVRVGWVVFYFCGR